MLGENATLLEEFRSAWCDCAHQSSATEHKKPQLQITCIGTWQSALHSISIHFVIEAVNNQQHRGTGKGKEERRWETGAEAAEDTIILESILPGGALYGAAGEPPALLLLVCPDVLCDV